MYSRVGLPFWLGAILIGFLPFLAILAVGEILAGLTDYFLSTFILFIPLFLVVNLYCQGAARYARIRIEKLVECSAPMYREKDPVRLNALYGLRGAMILWVLTCLILIPLFVVSQGQYTPYQTLLVSVAPWLYYALFFGTFFWTLSYSVYSLYKIGRLRLTLKHFTEDRTLGLKAFGTASLQLTGIYVVFVALFAVPNTVQGLVNIQFLALYAGLFLIALLLFILPLLSLHAKLLSAKREILTQLTPQYKELVQQLQSKGIRNVDEKLANQLDVLKHVLQDVNQIHSWPFDTGIIVRLSAIVLSVLTILLSRLITLALHL